MTAQRLGRLLASLLLIALVGFAGFRLGRALRPAAPVVQAGLDPFANLRLAEGGPFPDLRLEGAEGEEAWVSQMIAATGAVVLVLDLDCPPCKDLTAAWQVALDEATLADGQYAGALDPRLPVVGITVSPASRIAAYKEQQGLTFPIYTDPEHALAEGHGVTTFPLQLVVGRSGNIRSLAFSAQATDPAEALWLLSQ